MPTSARPGVKRETQRFFAGRVRFFILLVGADDPVRSLKCCDFASVFRKNGQFRGRTGSSAPTVQNGKSAQFRRKTAIKQPFLAGRCGHRPLRREMGNAAIFRRRHAAHKTKDTPIPAGRKPRDESIRDTSWCHPGSEDARPPFSRADGAEPGDFGGCTPYTHARRMSFALCAAGASQQNGSLSDRHAAVLLPRHCR